MNHVFCCACGHEEDVDKEVFSAGYVYQCTVCQKIWACVLTRLGPKVWIQVQKEIADFHKILQEPEEYDEV